jgi:hypothetical protein
VNVVSCSPVDLYRFLNPEDGACERICWLSYKICFMWSMEDLSDMRRAEKPTRYPKLSSLHNSKPKTSHRFWIKVLFIIIISVILEVSQFYNRFASFSIHSELLRHNLWFSFKASGKLVYHSRGNRISSLSFITILFIGITFSISCFALKTYRTSKRVRVGINKSKNAWHVNSIGSLDVFVSSLTLSYSGPVILLPNLLTS